MAVQLPVPVFSDAQFTLFDDADPTKRMQVQLSGLTTATTRTWSLPDRSDTFAGLAAQTFTGSQTFIDGGPTNLAIKRSGSNDGFFFGASQASVAVAGAERWRWSNNQYTGGQLVGSDSGFFAGTSAPMLQCHTTNGVSAGFARWSNDTQAGFIILSKSRGTALGSYTTVVAGDELGGIFFEGADGTNLRDTAAIRAIAEGAISTGIVPARLSFRTTNSAGSLTEALRLDSAQLATFFGNITITDAKNVAIGTTTGTKIGTATTQKIGFWNATPVVQPAGYGTPTGNVQTINFPGATATLLQTSQQLAQLMLDLKATGVIGA